MRFPQRTSSRLALIATLALLLLVAADRTTARIAGARLGA